MPIASPGPPTSRHSIGHQILPIASAGVPTLQHSIGYQISPSASPEAPGRQLSKSHQICPSAPPGVPVLRNPRHSLGGQVVTWPISLPQTPVMQAKQVATKQVSAEQLQPTLALSAQPLAMMGSLSHSSWSVIFRGITDGNQQKQQASASELGNNPEKLLAMDSAAKPPSPADDEAIANEAEVPIVKLSAANLRAHDQALGLSHSLKIVLPSSCDSPRSSSRTRTPEVSLRLLRWQSAMQPLYPDPGRPGHGRRSLHSSMKECCSSRTRSVESLTRVPSTWSEETLAGPLEPRFAVPADTYKPFIVGKLATAAV